MTDENPVEEVIEAGSEEVPEPVITPDPEPEPEDVHEPDPAPSRPSWADEILDRLDGIFERLAPASPVAEPGDDLNITDTPGNDESPVKPPWTHRRFFGGK